MSDRILSARRDVDHRVSQNADALDPAFDYVAGPHPFLRVAARTHTSGGAGGDPLINWELLGG